MTHGRTRRVVAVVGGARSSSRTRGLLRARLSCEGPGAHALRNFPSLRNAMKREERREKHTRSSPPPSEPALSRERPRRRAPRGLPRRGRACRTDEIRPHEGATRAQISRPPHPKIQSRSCPRTSRRRSGTRSGRKDLASRFALGRKREVGRTGPQTQRHLKIRTL